MQKSPSKGAKKKKRKEKKKVINWIIKNQIHSCTGSFWESYQKHSPPEAISSLRCGAVSGRITESWPKYKSPHIVHYVYKSSLFYGAQTANKQDDSWSLPQKEKKQSLSTCLPDLRSQCNKTTHDQDACVRHNGIVHNCPSWWKFNFRGFKNVPIQKQSKNLCAELKAMERNFATPHTTSANGHCPTSLNGDRWPLPD